MIDLPLTVFWRTPDRDFTPAQATTARLPLFSGPERHLLWTGGEASPISGVRISLGEGARFVLHSLILRDSRGLDLLRWNGVGEIFRDSYGIRLSPRGESVALETVVEGGGFSLALSPSNTDVRLQILLEVSLDPVSAVSPNGGPETVAAAVSHLHGKLQSAERWQEDVQGTLADAIGGIEKLDTRAAATFDRIGEVGRGVADSVTQVALLSELVQKQSGALLARVETLSARSEVLASELHASQVTLFDQLNNGQRQLSASLEQMHDSLALTQRVGALTAQLARAEQDLAALVARAEQLSSARDDERHRADQLAAQLSRAEQGAAALSEQVRELWAAHEAAAAQLQAVVQSSSWRVTGPIRTVVRVATRRQSVKSALARLFGGAPAARPPVVVGPPVEAASPSPLIGMDSPAEALVVVNSSLCESAETQPGETAQQPLPIALRPRLVFPVASAATAVGELLASPPQALDISVSVIIPTFNAGSEFYWLLRKVLGQRGLSRVEVVVVDSGSSDGTPELAEEFGCKVVRIPSSDFSHSYSRNLGADNATGDLYLFTVQDAYPIGDYWLHSLARALLEPSGDEFKAAAVSAAEYPRADSELLYNAAVETHSQFLGCWGRDRIGHFQGDGHMLLRSQGQLSDVACMIPAETFQKYRYQGRYAEDLVLGVRLLKDGLRTAMLSSARVIHSHNRPASYHLKRTFVDVVFLTEVFEDFTVPAASSLRSVTSTLSAMRPIVEEWRPNLGRNAADELCKFAADIRSLGLEEVSAPCDAFGFARLADWFANRDQGVYSTSDAEQLRNMYADRLEHLSSFVARTFGEVDSYLCNELRAAALKTLAGTTGAQLSFMYLYLDKQGPEEQRILMGELRDIMTAGI